VDLWVVKLLILFGKDSGFGVSYIILMLDDTARERCWSEYEARSLSLLARRVAMCLKLHFDREALRMPLTLHFYVDLACQAILASASARMPPEMTGFSPSAFSHDGGDRTIWIQ
jgi:hypothetical protein